MTDHDVIAMGAADINGRWPLLLPEHRVDWWTSNPRWEHERLASMHAVITAMAATRSPDRPVIFDVGAEEGDLPALWATWGADVALFEPNPAIWPNIRVIWETNQLPDPLFCFAGFAGPVTDLADGITYRATLDGPDVWPECAYGPMIGNHGFCNLNERPDLPRIRIDDTLRRAPDVLTLDVEGAELEVLRGATRVLTEHRPVVFVSVHPDFMADMYDHTPAQLDAHMADHGYDGQLLAVDHEHHMLYRHHDNWWPA